MTRALIPGGDVVNVTYDVSGRVSEISGGGVEITHAYEPTGLLQRAASRGGAAEYTYDGGFLKRESQTGDVAGVIDYFCDNNLHLASEIVTGTPAGHLSIRCRRTLDNGGRIIASRRSDNDALEGTTLGAVADQFTYNEFGEVLTYAVSYSNSGLIAFDYSRDQAGRITTINDSGFEYGPSGRLIRVTRTVPLPTSMTMMTMAIGPLIGGWAVL